MNFKCLIIISALLLPCSLFSMKKNSDHYIITEKDEYDSSEWVKKLDDLHKAEKMACYSETFTEYIKIINKKMPHESTNGGISFAEGNFVRDL